MFNYFSGIKLKFDTSIKNENMYYAFPGKLKLNTSMFTISYILFIIPHINCKDEALFIIFHLFTVINSKLNFLLECHMS